MKLLMLGYSLLHYTDGTWRWEVAWPEGVEAPATVNLSGSCQSQEEASSAARQAIEAVGWVREV